MSSWRDRGYVPDSDADDDSDFSIEPEEQQQGSIGLPTIQHDLDVTVPQPQQTPPVNSSIIVEHLPTIDLSEIPDEDTDDEQKFQTAGDPAILAYSPKDTAISDSDVPNNHVGDIQSCTGDITRPSGIDTARPVTPVRQQYNLTNSQEFSPLSDLPSNLSTPAASPVSRNRQSNKAAFSIIIPQIPTSPYIDATSPLAAFSPDRFTSGTLRNLRQRKPIQLNPYLLEQARYRETLKARGVKPIIFRPEDEQQARLQPGPEEDAYESSGGDEDESQPKHMRQLDTEDSQLDESIPVAQDSGSMVEDEWDLPDLETLLRGPFQREKTEIYGVKRRKLLHTYSGRFATAKPKPVWIQPILPPEPPTSKLRAPQTPIPIPSVPSIISSPSSDTASPALSVQRRPLNQHPGNTTADVTATQVISSDEASTPRAPTRQRSRAFSISSSSSSSSSSDKSNTSVDLRLLQKRTNGVLPASWWKLDYQRRKNQEKTGSKRGRKSLSPPRLIHQAGVAKAKISTKPRPQAEDFPTGGANESESESDKSIAVPLFPTHRPAQAEAAYAYEGRKTMGSWLGLDDDIIMEDDRIDAMLPKSGRKRQTKLKVPRVKRPPLDHAVGNSHEPSRSGNSRQDSGAYKHSSTHTKEQRPSGILRGNSKRTLTRPPRLSVIDVYRHQKATSQASPPRFLKVARRTALKRADLARRGPGRKLFILETEDDTREVQKVVRDWREGTLEVFAYTKALQAEGNDKLAAYSRHDEMDMGDPGGTSPVAFISPKAPRMPSLQHSTFARPKKPRQTLLKTIRMPGSAADKSRNPPLTKPRRGRQITLLPTAIPAQIQALSGEFYRKSVSLQRAATPLIDILRKQRPARPTGFSHPALAKFLQDDDLVVSPLAQLRKEQKQIQSASNHVSAPMPLVTEPMYSAPTNLRVRRIRRKNTPQRIDADTRQRRQPPPELPALNDEEPIQIQYSSSEQGFALTGLAPYGMRYSVNFDTHPLQPGTTFSAETFIGGTALFKALATLPAHERRHFQSREMTFVIGNQTFDWGIYRDSIATEFELIMEKLVDGIDKAFDKSSYEDVDAHLFASQVYSFYRSCSNFVAEILHFSDSVDVISFCQRFLKVLYNCFLRVSTTFANINGKPDLKMPATKLGIQAQWFVLLLAFQIDRLSVGLSDDVRRTFDLELLIGKFAQSLISRLVRCGIEVVRECYEDQRIRSRHERGITAESYIVETWVMAINILDRISSHKITFWRLFNSELHADELAKVTDVAIYERCWKMTFSLLPLFQFNQHGVINPGGEREHKVIENWELLKRLASAFLGHYKYNGDRPTINDYCRIIYTRTHHLITKWGWTNADSMTATLFSFFASNSLPNLRNETDHGSPLFLQQLDRQPTLAAEESDRCFHLLLKIIAVGLNSMKATSTTKRIRDYVFRLMPNHRRQYPKEEDLNIEHLTALRNHHDLLCTLYWASPPTCRPPLSAIRDLVDPKTSHIQACAVSVRAWSYLIRFQLSADEDIKHLEPLMAWYDDILEQILVQHNSCRAEATKQFGIERDKGNFDVSEVDLENTVRRNHRQLEGLLLEAVRALGTAMNTIQGKIPSAMKLLTPTGTGKLFGTFNKVSHKLVIEALEVVNLYVKACQNSPVLHPQSDSVSQQATEESQDYGDSSGMEDLVLEEERKAAGRHLLTVVYEPLLRMMSSALGADQQPADVFLLKIIDTWVRVGGFLVQQGLKAWDVYLDSYSRESWASFRDTLQTRKFTAYYMSMLIDTYNDVYSSNKAILLSYWIRTLVERKSMLQYQHLFTNSLLNVDPENLILQNLPFARTSAGVYKISLTEFEARRISLIEMVLSNMRVSYERSLFSSTATLLRGEYSQILQHLMNSMRDNYLTLQQIVNPANLTTASSTPQTDSYVTFVQQVVSLLQQHTPDIHPIDKFFTDSAVFPLPSDDPTYVISKLRNYGLTLTQSRKHRQLTAFFQTLCERAAVDGEQEYLVNQLVLAMEGEREQGGDMVTLRSFLFRGVFPAYAECAFGCGTAGWMLAMPIARTVTRIVAGIRAEIDSCEFGNIRGFINTLGEWVECVLQALVNGFVDQEVISGWIARGPDPTLAMVVLLVESVVGCLPVLDWLLVHSGQIQVEEDGTGGFYMETKRVTELVEMLIGMISWTNECIFNLTSQACLITFNDIYTEVNTALSGIGTRSHSGSNNFEQIHSSYLASLHSSLKQEWHPAAVGSKDLVLFRNGVRRPVNRKSTTSWQEVFGGERGAENHEALTRRVMLEFFETAARTEVWGNYVRWQKKDVWDGEVGRRGRAGRAGRARRAEVGTLFC